MIYYETDYLAHHGVKGMKWGIRKRRVSKGRSRSSNTSKHSRKKWSNKKKVAIGAAIVGGTALAAIGGIVITKKVRANQSAKLAKNLMRQRSALDDLAAQGKRALERGAKRYEAGNQFGRVIAETTDRGTKISTVAVDRIPVDRIPIDRIHPRYIRN